MEDRLFHFLLLLLLLLLLLRIAVKGARWEDMYVHVRSTALIIIILLEILPYFPIYPKARNLTRND